MSGGRKRGNLVFRRRFTFIEAVGIAYAASIGPQHWLEALLVVVTCCAISAIGAIGVRSEAA